MKRGLVALLLTGCIAHPMDGVFLCETEADCPDGWVCQADHCYRSLQDAGRDRDAGRDVDAGITDGGRDEDAGSSVDAGMRDAGGLTQSGGVVSLSPADDPSSGSLVLIEQSFESSEMSCSGTLCVYGGIGP